MPDPAKMREGRSGRATRDTVTAGPCEGRQDRGGAEGKCAWGVVLDRAGFVGVAQNAAALGLVV